MTDQPIIAEKAPKPVEVQEGKTYWWCTCGKSTNQPFCNGAHKDTSFTPMQWTAPASKIVYFCQCKHSANAPLCDGAHNKL